MADRHFVAAAQTDIGITKKVNQDCFSVKVAKTRNGEIAFAVLCDGMGGLSCGEVASAHVVKSFENWFFSEVTEWVHGEKDTRFLFGRWNQLIHQCNQDILQYENSNHQDMGTTLTCMMLFENHYYVAHVGDCRIYEMEDGIRQITKDHTFVAREIAAGRMTPEQASTDPRRNVLLQCIGVNEQVEPEFIQGELRDNMSLLLCSDGFRHEISRQEILQFCKTNLLGTEKNLVDRKKMQEAADRQLAYLIELNKNRNERDNISAILLQVFDQ